MRILKKITLQRLLVGLFVLICGFAVGLAQEVKIRSTGPSGQGDLIFQGEDGDPVMKITKEGVSLLKLTDDITLAAEEGKMLVGNESNVLTAVTLSGAMTMTAAGEVSLVGEAGKILIGDTNNVLQAVTPSGAITIDTEGVVSLVGGVTTNITVGDYTLTITDGLITQVTE